MGEVLCRESENPCARPGRRHTVGPHVDCFAMGMPQEASCLLLASVPEQPGASELEADPLLHRFVTIVDGEGANYKLLSVLWKERVGAVT